MLLWRVVKVRDVRRKQGGSVGWFNVAWVYIDNPPRSEIDRLPRIRPRNAESDSVFLHRLAFRSLERAPLCSASYMCTPGYDTVERLHQDTRDASCHRCGHCHFHKLRAGGWESCTPAAPRPPGPKLGGAPCWMYGMMTWSSLPQNAGQLGLERISRLTVCDGAALLSAQTVPQVTRAPSPHLTSPHTSLFICLAS